MCSSRKRTRRNERSIFLIVLAFAVLLLGSYASAQIYLPKAPPEPSAYGRVILQSHVASSPGPVVFDHWLHRSKYTCRLCHVDVGFAMRANTTGISASTNREGFHCGACHDGKRVIEGKTIFASCSADADGANHKQCARCHFTGKKGGRKYEYNAFAAKLPAANYGVDWEAAEKSGVIKPIDFLDGLSAKKARIQNREDFSIKAGLSWVNPINFSHEKHSIWNGCELCHPEIFPTAKKGEVSFTMYSILKGRRCGACHGKVASPLNNCQKCHPRGPDWAEN